MNIRINAESGVPIYMQIVDRIRHLVATGVLRPGQQLPTIRQLAVDLRVDPNTVARAYAILDSQGVISTQQGRGTYIAEHPDEARLAAFREEQLRQIMSHAILDALSLGYRPDEVQDAFLQELTQWQKRTERAHTETNTQNT
ncbi:MAG: GntR family transcriptional regulator [Chloroflexi bacterium]|nr:GntR family transcriptional regulator [Chloroflexota bacterium]